MANHGPGSQPRLRVSGVAAHVHSGSVAFSCQVEELSAAGAFLRTDQPFSAGSEVDLDLVKPGARKVLHVGGRVCRAVPSGQGQHPGLEIEFSSMSGDDSARLAGWLEEMMARGTAKAVAPAFNAGEDRPGEKEVPEPVPALAISGDHLLAIPHPVLVPAVDGHTVMHVDVLDAADLESGLLELRGDERERQARVGTGKDV